MKNRIIGLEKTETERKLNLFYRNWTWIKSEIIKSEVIRRGVWTSI